MAGDGLQLSEKNVKLLVEFMSYLPDNMNSTVDWEAIAKDLGYKGAKSARDTFNQIRVKLRSYRTSNDSEADPTSTPNTPKSTKVKGAQRGKKAKETELASEENDETLISHEQSPYKKRKLASTTELEEANGSGDYEACL